MSKRNYMRALDAAKRELEDLLARRDQIDKRVGELKTTIKNLEILCGARTIDPTTQTLAQMSPSMGITDLIRLALKNSAEPISPKDVARQVYAWRPDFDKNHNLLASTHTVLKRLVKGGEVKQVPGLGPKKNYKWISDISRVFESVRIERGKGFLE